MCRKSRLPGDGGGSSSYWTYVDDPDNAASLRAGRRGAGGTSDTRPGDPLGKGEDTGVAAPCGRGEEPLARAPAHTVVRNGERAFDDAHPPVRRR
ncbi:hypothetical protein GCM10018966_048500 [Streptomyces yanii]